MAKGATLRQKRVAKLKVENLNLDKPLTDGEIVERSGFGPSMKKNPHVIMKSKGVLMELKAIGFHEDNAKRVVGEILDDHNNEPKDRLKASELIFKVHGSFAPDKHINVSLQVSSEERDKILGISSKVKEEMIHGEING